MEQQQQEVRISWFRLGRKDTIVGARGGVWCGRGGVVDYYVVNHAVGGAQSEKGRRACRRMRIPISHPTNGRHDEQYQ